MRRTVLLNRDWRFKRDDPAGAESPDFDDSNWERVGLPHTFDLPYFRTPEFYVGTGWYRKRITNPGPLSALEFDGAFQVAQVFVDGEMIGEHQGGYTGFEVPIPARARSSEILIAVRVNNEWNPQMAPRAGEHIFSGGLYRDVRLTEGGLIAWNGVHVTTPAVSRDAGIVRVRTELRAAEPRRGHCRVRQTVLDPDGIAVTSFESTQRTESAEPAAFDQTSGPIASPELWHPDHPHLYRLKTEVFLNDELADEVETPFGFRWFEWTADRGFFLNGEHLYLRGANAHQDRAGWGIASTRAGCERDVRLIKEAGFNFVRGAHYPHHPAFADACDRVGLIFLAENCFWGKGGFGPEGYWNASAFPPNREDWPPFREHCRQTLREMIRIDRNHPSIVGWSMTNEAFFTFNVEEAKSLVRELVALSHDMDPTRPAVIGGAQRGGFDKLGDVAAYNGDGARLFTNPGVPNMVSEYGAISKPADADEPFWGELQRERFPWRSGETIWCGFDYGSIAGRQGLKGIIDHYRLPKRSWHWYRRVNLRIAPPVWTIREARGVKLELSADKTTMAADGTDDTLLVVKVLDDHGRWVDCCPAVTLEVLSGPGELPTGRSITFAAGTDIQIVAGRAGIEMRAYRAGRTVLRATSPGLSAAEIVIESFGAEAFVEGVTPVVKQRAYVPPVLSEQAVRSLKSVVNVAKDRPSRASSEEPDLPSRLANDGDAATTWRAQNGEAWWEVDMEGYYQISGSRITFATPGEFRYRVELSEDRKEWSEAVNRRQEETKGMCRQDVYPPGATARYLRVIFLDVPAGVKAELAEVEVNGVLAPG